MAERQLPLFPSQPSDDTDISKHTPLKATLNHFHDFLIREGKSEHTVKAFIGDMNLLAEYTNAETPVGQYTTTRLNEYLRWMEHGRGVPCSRKTYARRVTTLKVYFRWLRAIHAIPHDPAQAVLQRSGPAPLSKVLSPQQVRDVIDAAQRMKKGDHIDYRPELLFQLLLQSGIKKSETGRLKLKDIDRSNPQQPVIFIRHKAKNVYKERRIGVEPEWIQLLDLYTVQYNIKDVVFTCTTRNLEYILTDIGKLAGIDFKLSFEVMRWTCAVRDHRHEMDEEAIREKLGLSKTSWYETGQKIKQLTAQQIEQESL